MILATILTALAASAAGPQPAPPANLDSEQKLMWMYDHGHTPHVTGTSVWRNGMAVWKARTDASSPISIQKDDVYPIMLVNVNLGTLGSELRGDIDWPWDGDQKTETSIKQYPNRALPIQDDAAYITVCGPAYGFPCMTVGLKQYGSELVGRWTPTEKGQCAEKPEDDKNIQRVGTNCGLIYFFDEVLVGQAQRE